MGCETEKISGKLFDSDKEKLNLDQVRAVLKLDEHVLSLAKQMFKQKSLLVMGRGYNYATCLEGALKVKELSYLHCEGIMSGELKHGPLAMVDDTMPIVMIICKDNVFNVRILILIS